MAKRGIDEHPKVIEFAELLGIPVCYAVGPLELFWHWVARYRPNGDISGIKPSAIAHAIRFPGKGEDLMNALLESGLVDRETYLVHDWSEHADNSVHQLLKKRGENFADGCEPFTRNRRRELSGSQTVHEPFTNGSCLPEPEPEPEPEVSLVGQDPTPKALARDQFCRESIEFLNSEAGRGFDPNPAKPIAKALRALWNRSSAQERLELPEKVEDVVRFKVREWGSDAKMKRYLNPDTLFGGHFDRYYTEAREWADEEGTGGVGQVFVLDPSKVDWGDVAS